MELDKLLGVGVVIVVLLLSLLSRRRSCGRRGSCGECGSTCSGSNSAQMQDANSEEGQKLQKTNNR